MGLSWLVFLLGVFVSCPSVRAGHVLGSFDAAETLKTVRAQPYNFSDASFVSPPVMLALDDENVTGQWVDFESQTFFASTRKANGHGRILRTSLPSGGSTRGVWWYGGSIGGVIHGLTGSRALNSPSIYWVWEPTRSSSPPFTNAPALYRMPVLGGYPEVVTLHAQLCEQMSIVKLSLFCSVNASSLYHFDMTRPNAAYELLTVPEPLASDVPWRGFVASRQEVLFVLGASHTLYRWQSPSLEAKPWPKGLVSTAWGPNLYSPPTDRLLVHANDTKLWQWVGMDSFWSDLPAGPEPPMVNVSRSSEMGNGTNTTSEYPNGIHVGATVLLVTGFSASVLLQPCNVLVLFALVLSICH